MFLLDTNALIYAVLAPAKLSSSARSIILDKGNTILVSAASAWELSTKVRIGKLNEAIEFEANFLADVSEAGYTLLPISVEDALRAGRLPGSHGDPFDRMIAAQAIARDVPVIGNDAKLDTFGVKRIW